MKRTGRGRKIGFGVTGRNVVSRAGGRLLVETAAKIGLDTALGRALAPWRLPGAVHDPGKTVLDLAVILGLGGTCPADLAGLRAEPAVYGPVASDATVSRLVAALVRDDGGQAAVEAIGRAVAAARDRAWKLGGAPLVDGMLVIDPDATLVTAYSAKQGARPTFKKTIGLHPLLCYLDHGAAGTGEPAAMLLRAGNAGSNTAVDHITVLKQTLEQIPAAYTRPDQHGRRRILVRADGAGASHAFINWLHAQGMQFSIRLPLAGPDITDLATQLPDTAWAAAADDPDTIAQVTEITDPAWLHNRPPGTRLIVRREHPNSGAKHQQMSISDVDGKRYTAFLTNTPDLTATQLERRHRLHARVEDRIKDGKNTGLRRLPYPDLASNRIWLAIIAIAQTLLTHTTRLALTGRWRVASPKTLRQRLFATAGLITTTGRRTRLDLPATWPWTDQLLTALQRLAALPNPT